MAVYICANTASRKMLFVKGVEVRLEDRNIIATELGLFEE
jgi:hypothetical protein